MPKLPADRNPSHRRHASGQGVVVLSGKHHYTGLWGTDESEQEYLRVVGEWNARGRKIATHRVSNLDIARLARAYSDHARARFTKRGETTSYGRQVIRVARYLSSMYGNSLIRDFGPKSLHTLRASWINPSRGNPCCIRTATGYTKIVIEMFKWGVSEELFAAEYLQRLETLEPLTERDGGFNYPRKLSVPLGDVSKALETLPEVAKSIVQLMLLTGMRPSEACSIRVQDLDQSGDVWTYSVTSEWNKSEHRDRPRVVFIGPRAQELLRPRIERAGKGGWLFTPSRGTHRNRAYLASTLKDVVAKRLRMAGITHWSPHRLRHNALTSIREALSIEHAKSVGGHSNAKTTAIYIDPEILNSDDREAAKAAALAMG